MNNDCGKRRQSVDMHALLAHVNRAKQKCTLEQLKLDWKFLVREIPSLFETRQRVPRQQALKHTVK